MTINIMIFFMCFYHGKNVGTNLKFNKKTHHVTLRFTIHSSMLASFVCLISFEREQILLSQWNGSISQLHCRVEW